MLSTLFDEAKPLAIDHERSMLRIGFPSSAKFNKKKAEAKGNIDRMTEAITVIVGTSLRPVYELVEEEEDEAAEVQLFGQDFRFFDTPLIDAAEMRYWRNCLR